MLSGVPNPNAGELGWTQFVSTESTQLLMDRLFLVLTLMEQALPEYVKYV